MIATTDLGTLARARLLWSAEMDGRFSRKTPWWLQSTVARAEASSTTVDREHPTRALSKNDVVVWCFRECFGRLYS